MELISASRRLNLSKAPSGESLNLKVTTWTRNHEIFHKKHPSCHSKGFTKHMALKLKYTENGLNIKGNLFTYTNHYLKLGINIFQKKTRSAHSTDHQGTIICGKGREWSITGDDGLVQGDIRLSRIDLLSGKRGVFRFFRSGFFPQKLAQTFEIHWCFDVLITSTKKKII